MPRANRCGPRRTLQWSVRSGAPARFVCQCRHARPSEATDERLVSAVHEMGRAYHVQTDAGRGGRSSGASGAGPPHRGYASADPRDRASARIERLVSSALFSVREKGRAYHGTRGNDLGLLLPTTGPPLRSQAEGAAGAGAQRSALCDRGVVEVGCDRDPSLRGLTPLDFFLIHRTFSPVSLRANSAHRKKWAGLATALGGTT